MKKVKKLMRKIVRSNEATLMKVCRNYLPQMRHNESKVGRYQAGFKSYGNPCLDLFYYVVPNIDYRRLSPEGEDLAWSQLHMKRLLPSAWGHCPVTTLKIIRTWDDVGVDGLFDDALYWLHYNHPKTLACNLIPLLIGRPDGHHQGLAALLNRILDLKQVPGDWHKLEHVKEINNMIKLVRSKGAISEQQKPMMIVSQKILKMYEREPDLRFLHDEIAHLFAESLKFDIENFLKKEREYVDGQVLEATGAAEYCDGSPLLLDSVASRVFPQFAFERAVEVLKDEVLEPLTKVLDQDNNKWGVDGNVWGYEHYRHKGSDPLRKKRWPIVHKYLKGLEQSPNAMVADALLPNELVRLCLRSDIPGLSTELIELQWKAMVEDLKKKQLRVLSRSLALIDAADLTCRFSELAFGLAILISELNEEEAWKGKVMSMIPDLLLLSSQGHDLMSRCKFLSDPATMLPAKRPKRIDWKEVFDLILQRAVNESLEPEQMIKKIFVFSLRDIFVWFGSGWFGLGWEAQDYDEMRSKYKEHGYDIPQIVFWRHDLHLDMPEQMPFTDAPDERGVAAISGFGRADRMLTSASVCFIKMFLENDGQMNPQHAMEATLYDQDYNYAHRLVIVD